MPGIEGRARRSHRDSHSRLRQAIEPLEDRRLLSTWYVSPTGNDAGAGSLAAPWQTVQHALDSAASGDSKTLPWPIIDAACSVCHDYSQHSAHPIGEKAVDPRNPNLRVNCLSCHKAHGTEFKRMLLAGTNVELCTACHKKFVR